MRDPAFWNNDFNSDQSEQNDGISSEPSEDEGKPGDEQFNYFMMDHRKNNNFITQELKI